MAAAAVARAAPIPGLLELVAEWRRQGIKIGSPTGYTDTDMAALVPAAAKHGYRPEAWLRFGGFPRPVLSLNMLSERPQAPGIYHGRDGQNRGTLPDIQEGLNAGMWTVGVTCSGNEMGLDAAEVAGMDRAVLNSRLDAIGQCFREAEAHYVIDGIWAAAAVVGEINRRLAQGETPATTAG